MADTQVLGTCVFGRAGSSPASRTRIFNSSGISRIEWHFTLMPLVRHDYGRGSNPQ